MTKDDGHLYDMAEISDDFFKKQYHNDNLTLVDTLKLSEKEKYTAVVKGEKRIFDVDLLKNKSRRVRRTALKDLRKMSKGKI